MNGVIAAGSPQTAEAGAEILRAGGNAVDAAVAAAFASFIAEPAISSLAGGGFAMVHPPDSEPVLIDFFCTLPSLSRPADELDFTAVPVQFADITGDYTIGRGSVAVPGNPAGLTSLLAEYGTLPLETVLAPAISLARNGFTVNKERAEVMASLKNIMAYTPETQALFTVNDEFIGEGDTFKNPALGNTLESLAKHGADSFYKGEIADLIVKDQHEHGGLITAEDLAHYEVIKRQPLHVNYRGHDIYLNPPPSAGGKLIAYSLMLLAHTEIKGHMVFVESDHIALLAEIMRQCDLSRDVETFTEDMAAAGWQAIQKALESGTAKASASMGSGSGSTTHISAIDQDGLAIGITITPGATAGYMLGDTGILMNNILGEKDLHANGFHQWDESAVGSRVTSMMSPSVGIGPDGEKFVVGSAGSSRLRGAIMQVISNVLDWGLPPAVAVNAPRIHFENSLLDLELGYREYAADALEARGYTLRKWDTKNLYFGGTNIAVRSGEGHFSGGGDIRRGGAVVIIDSAAPAKGEAM